MVARSSEVDVKKYDQDGVQSVSNAASSNLQSVASSSESSPVREGANLYDVAKTENILHHFKSYNYLFTLAALENSVVSDISKLAASAEKYVVARSHGKVKEGLDVEINPIYKDQQVETGVLYDSEGVRLLPVLVPDYGGKKLVEQFNSRSSGRFNFYFQDLEIESIMAFDKRTGFAKANKISFTIVEPYSLSGFIEALQVAAVAAGHPTYKSAPFVLKVEFKGYPDWTSNPSDDWKQIEPATRYFVIRFTEVQIKADDTGTRYFCKAVPINEIAYGESNKLKTNISMAGKTVKEILNNLMNEVNKTTKQANGVSESATIRGNQAQCDEYEIFFPVQSLDGKVIWDQENSAIANSVVADLARDNVNYEFVDPIEKQKREGIPGRRVTYNPLTPSVQFASQSNIHDIIATVVRDSVNVQQILKDIETYIKDGEFVDYFTIGIEILPKNLWDPLRNQPFYTYRYYVLPYTIHYTKIPGFESKTIDPANIKKFVRRTYNYLYTGKNIDIISLNLNFNHLYFQTQPYNQGNKSIYGQRSAFGTNGGERVAITYGSDPSKIAQGQGNEPSPLLIDTRGDEVQYGNGSTRYTQEDPYQTLARNLSQAILDNTAMSMLDIEIIGDPVYLVQNGIGNIRSESLPGVFSLTKTGDYDNLIGDIYIEVKFKNPVDVPDETGAVTFNEVSTFSGLFKVNTVKSRFSDGQFKQTLSLYRIPGQPEETKQPSGIQTDINIYQDFPTTNFA